MHEMSLINDLMAKIARVARDNDATRVVAVTVRLGALAHISAEHFREHFEEAAAGGVADGARLAIEVHADIHDPHAQDILLTAIEVEEARAGAS